MRHQLMADIVTNLIVFAFAERRSGDAVTTQERITKVQIIEAMQSLPDDAGIEQAMSVYTCCTRSSGASINSMQTGGSTMRRPCGGWPSGSGNLIAGGAR
jgi:hypothetical protein